MIYPEFFEEKIKFDKIRLLVKNQCLSDMGRELTDEMSFSGDESIIRVRLGETSEFMRIEQEEELPGNNYSDARPFLNKIRIIGLFLDTQELVALKNSLETVNVIVRFFNLKREAYPFICAKAGEIKLFPFVLQRLDGIVSKHGTIKDNASQELQDIRGKLLKKQSGISKRMQSILQQAQSEGWIDKDSTVAIRDGRMVIPVSSAYKRKINGIIHDESATGKTSYIEPSEIVGINNEIRELQLEEKREIQRILLKFADDIRPYIDDLIPAYDFLAFVDFIRAKARFALKIGGIVPVFSDRPEMFWKEAKHPLLLLAFRQSGKTLVPLNIEINEDQRIILISGPNAGGKSVCLQTTGLLQYMFQCGLPVPVSEASVFGIFQSILIDIGDEQSIENDLSTYSSHLINMKNFVRYGDDKTLILIDEFGTGTEPMLGGALAEAILNTLNQNKVKGVITTHYTNLKHFAASTSGIENGAMLYDNHRMLPLFELQIGKPGSSFAFEIARKIGLPKEILDDAAAKVGEENINYDKHLKDIARDKKYWEDKRKKIHENEKRLEEVLEKYNKELSETSKLRKEIIREAQEKAKTMIEQANKTIENTISEIRESQAEKEKTKIARRKLVENKELLQTDVEEDERINRKIERIKEREKRKSERKPKVKPNTTTDTKSFVDLPLKVGEQVMLPNKAIGEIIEIKSNKAVIALGNISTQMSIDKLQRISGSQAKKISHAVSPPSNWNTFRESITQKKLHFKPELDVRGMRGEEALQKVMEFVDDAVMLDMKDIRILHGTGTGALRQMIRQQLACNPIVGTFGDEHVQFGGAGITVIHLDI